MAASLSPASRFFYAARGLAYLGYAAFAGIAYDLGDFRTDSDEVLAELIERNG